MGERKRRSTRLRPQGRCKPRTQDSPAGGGGNAVRGERKRRSNGKSPQGLTERDEAQRHPSRRLGRSMAGGVDAERPTRWAPRMKHGTAGLRAPDPTPYGAGAADTDAPARANRTRRSAAEPLTAFRALHGGRCGCGATNPVGAPHETRHGRVKSARPHPLRGRRSGLGAIATADLMERWRQPKKKPAAGGYRSPEARQPHGGRERSERGKRSRGRGAPRARRGRGAGAPPTHRASRCAPARAQCKPQQH